MKLQCSYCKDPATLLESEPDVSDLASAVCNDCVSGLRCCPTEPLAALRRDSERLARVRALVSEWQASEDPSADAGLAMTTLAEALDSDTFK